MTMMLDKKSTAHRRLQTLISEPSTEWREWINQTARGKSPIPPDAGNLFNLVHRWEAGDREEVYIQHPITMAKLYPSDSIPVILAFSRRVQGSDSPEQHGDVFQYKPPRGQPAMVVCQISLPQSSPIQIPPGPPCHFSTDAKKLAAFILCKLLAEGNLLLSSDFPHPLPMRRSLVDGKRARIKASLEGVKLPAIVEYPSIITPFRLPPLEGSVHLPQKLFGSIFYIRAPASGQQPFNAYLWSGRPIIVLTTCPLPVLGPLKGKVANSVLQSTQFTRPQEISPHHLKTLSKYSQAFLSHLVGSGVSQDPSNRVFFIAPIIANWKTDLFEQVEHLSLNLSHYIDWVAMREPEFIMP